MDDVERVARILHLSRAGDLAGVLRREGMSAEDWDAARLQLATTLAADATGDARRRFERAYRQAPGAPTGGPPATVALPPGLDPSAGAPRPPTPHVPDVPIPVQVPSFLVAERGAESPGDLDPDRTLPPVWRPGPILPFVGGAASPPAPPPREVSPTAGETVELVDLEARASEGVGDDPDGDATLFLRLPEGTRR